MRKHYINPIECIIDANQKKDTGFLEKFSYFLVVFMWLDIFNSSFFLLDFVVFSIFFLFFFSFYKLSLINFSSFENHLKRLDRTKYKTEDIHSAFLNASNLKEIKHFLSFEKIIILVFIAYSFLVSNYFLFLVSFSYFIYAFKFHTKLKCFIFSYINNNNKNSHEITENNIN